MIPRIIRMLSWLVLVGPIGGHTQDFEHIESAGSSTFEPYSEDKSLGRLVDAAIEYEQFAPVPRIAFFDMTFPLDATEYESLNGYTLVTVTAISQDSDELPLARVYVRAGEREINLYRVTGLESILDGPREVVDTFGVNRYDAIYEFPMMLRAIPVELVIDFARSRSGFVLSTFPNESFPDQFPVQVPTAERADADAVAAMIAREIPLLSTTE